MALPKIDVPMFELELPSNGKKVRFRPFTVKEEKLFLMAAQSEEPDNIINTIIQVLNNCILDDFDVQKASLFDIEFLFLNLRARSIGEVVELSYKCNNEVLSESGDMKQCGNIVNIDVNLLEIAPDKDNQSDKKIELSGQLGMMMKYPTLNVLNMEKQNNLDDIDVIIEMIIDCIEYIYDADSIYYAKDSTKEELMEFLDSLQSKELDKIKSFFDTLPKLEKKIDFDCKKCGHKELITLEGIQNFFV